MCVKQKIKQNKDVAIGFDTNWTNKQKVIARLAPHSP